MNNKMSVSLGTAILAVLGTIAFVPASADSRDEAGMRASGMVVAQASVATETPQSEVWDMTYGAERPVLVEEPQAVAQDDTAIVDYTFG